jgi:hypothetical protein
MVTFGNTPLINLARTNNTRYTLKDGPRITKTFRLKEKEGTQGIGAVRPRVFLPKYCQGSAFIVKRCFKIYT